MHLPFKVTKRPKLFEISLYIDKQSNSKFFLLVGQKNKKTNENIIFKRITNKKIEHTCCIAKAAKSIPFSIDLQTKRNSLACYVLQKINKKYHF
jgi:hypothetical protein